VDKIRNTTIAKRTSRAVLSPGKAASAASRSRPRAQSRPRSTVERKNPRLVYVLAFAVAGLFLANVFIFVSGMPKEALSSKPEAGPNSASRTLLAAAPGFASLGPSEQDVVLASPAAQAQTSPGIQTAVYSTDIDDLSGYSLIVNKSRTLSPEYEPEDLDYPDVPFAKGKMKARQEAARAFERMQRAAASQGVKFYFYSGYRDYAYQKQIWENSIKVNGREWAQKYIAPPGASEHQTGLAIDVSCEETKQQLEESFADTPSGRWLSAHCAEFGFTLRYPKGKEALTGYNYEPWHFRYVGEGLARDLGSGAKTMEEFFSLAP
jgi:D-alanyl-D-alanine carboxypeptidase